MIGRKDAFLLPLKLHMFSHAGGPLQEWDRVARTAEIVLLEAGERLASRGEPHPYLYLVTEGVLKVHDASGDARDRTLSFYEESQLACSLSAMGPPGIKRVIDSGLDIQPDELRDAASGRGTTSITALTSARLLRMDYPVLQDLALKYARWAELMSTHLTANLLHTQAEMTRMRALSAEEHFRWLRVNRPTLVSRITQREIASYLGVTEVGLSRIASRIRVSAA